MAEILTSVDLLRSVASAPIGGSPEDVERTAVLRRPLQPACAAAAAGAPQNQAEYPQERQGSCVC